jgi:hypothetical protein
MGEAMAELMSGKSSNFSHLWGSVYLINFFEIK